MVPRLDVVLFLVCGLVLWGGGCGVAPTCPKPPPSIFLDPEIQGLTPEQRDADLAFLSELLSKSYPHLAEKERRFGVEVSEVVADHRAALHRAVNRYQYMAAVDRILLAFRDGHLATVGYRRAFQNTYRPPGSELRPATRPRPKPESVDVGLTFRYVEGQVAVVEVRPGSPAEKAGVRQGDAVLMVGHQAALSRLGSSLTKRGWARLEAGIQLAASRMMIRRPWHPDTDMPKERLVLSRGKERLHLLLHGARAPDPHEHAFLFRPERCQVGVLRVRTFAGPREAQWKRLQALLAEARAFRGLVLDLRGNGGGSQGLARRLVEHLLHAEVLAGAYRYRRMPVITARVPVVSKLPADPEDSTWTVWREDRLRPAEGGLRVPIAVITDALCASSCETVVRALQSAPEARLFGQATAGSSGLPVTLELPQSGLRLTMPTWQSRTAGGHLLEGNGVPPDTLVPLTLEALRARRDEPLEASLDHLCWVLSPEM